MADGTKIEWTDATVNAVNGCSVISPGCKHCYAMKQAHRFPVRQGLTRKTAGGMVWTGEVRLNESALLQPLAWKRPRKIFWNAHGDLFHENVPDEWVDMVFAVCALTPHHQHQILTKRADRMRRYMESIDNGDGERLEGFRSALVEGMAQKIWHDRTGDSSVDEWLAVQLPLPNVWLGVSVEDQQRADERIPDLLGTPAAVRFLSCEPLLGPVDLGEWLICPNARDGLSMDMSTGQYECCSSCDWTGLIGDISWVIAGGESGPGARPMHPDWARGLRNQCTAAGVSFFFKQWGEWGPIKTTGHGDPRYPADPPVGERMERLGKKAAGRLLDGVQHDGMPADV
jgi:protein gp37